MKLLIVDDEYLARESLEIQISKLTDYQILQAKDGVTALTIMEDERPDIVFIDIQMPGMSGIEFMERGRKICSQAVFIVLSGYNLFEYAQKAIEYNAFKYLLKPVSDESLSELFEEIESQLLTKQIENIKHKEAYMSAQRSKKILQRKYVLELLNVKEAKKADVLQKLKKSGIVFDKPYFQIFIIRIVMDSIEEEELLKFGIINIAEEIFKATDQSVCAFDEENGLGILINSEGRQEASAFETYIDIMFEEIQKFSSALGVERITIGISERKAGIEILDELYDAALQALNMYLIHGDNRLYFAKEKPVDDKNGNWNKQNLEKRFEKALFMGSKVDVEDCIENLYVQFSDSNFTDVKELHKLHLSFFVLLHKAMKNLETEGVLEDEFYLYKKIQQFESIEEMKHFLLKKTEICLEAIGGNSVTGNKKAVQIGKQFINENLGNELTLNAVAEHVGLSLVYFSKIFKEEEGKNFIDYVTEQRMQLACELLEGNAKTSEICERIGYHDMKHFYKVFKKYRGITPSQYRKRVR
ncbi:MAG: response regulator [Hespellia sp.]|nr:response regulator [Hespellia sp.]